MRSKIHEGFHRAGLVVSIPLAACSVIVSGLTAWEWFRTSGSGDIKALVFFAVAFAVLSVGAYAVARAVGWIVDGFVG